MKSIILVIFFLIALPEEEYNPTTFVFPAYKHTYGIRKAGPTALFMLMGFSVKFRDPQGLACVRLDSWEDPDDPHDDDEVTVYGINSGQNNIIYNKSMWKLGVFELDEDDVIPLSEPKGICANSSGDVYVADTGNNRIVRLHNPKDQLEYVAVIGKEGDGEGQFRNPKQVSMTSWGDVYVSDSGNDRIQVFDSANVFKYAFTFDGYLQAPNAIVLADSLERHTFIKENFLIVVDSSNSRINKFTLEGKLIKSVQMNNLGFTEVNLAYACLDYYNQLVITDSKNHCIHKFSNNLDYIVSFGKKGDDDHEFQSPRGITIYKRFGQIFIAEESGAQYYWVGTDLKDFSISSKTRKIIFSFMATEHSYFWADIVDEDGNFITRIAHRRMIGPLDKQHIEWNGIVAKTGVKIVKNEDLTWSDIVTPGKRVPPGTYKIRINLEPTYSSRTHFIRVEEQIFEYLYEDKTKGVN